MRDMFAIEIHAIIFPCTPGEAPPAMYVKHKHIITEKQNAEK